MGSIRIKTLFIFIVGLFTFSFHAGLCYADQRSFLMGTSVIADELSVEFENLSDKDFLSLHLDDFYGIPWEAFINGTDLPSHWVSRWTSIATQATASGKVLYLSVSPLTGRKTLTDSIAANGNRTSNWAPTDSNGCYEFSSDPNTQVYKQAYIRYLKWLITLIQPTYVSPVIEINGQFYKCPGEKAAFKQWYADIYQELKATYPQVIIFPTFQMETMYGMSDSESWCGGARTNESLASCFDSRLTEALTLPSDRLGFSTYPYLWLYPPTAPDTYTPVVPLDDMFRRVQSASNLKIIISETGWVGAPIYQSYEHTTPPSSCGPIMVPPEFATEAQMSGYLTNLLAQAKSRRFEAVVWWENRDLLDSALASVCPCPGSNPTCNYADLIYNVAGLTGELQLRLSGNMGLRQNDGTVRNSLYSVWGSYLNQMYPPIPTETAGPLDFIKIYPNPMHPSKNHAGINFSDMPPASRVTVTTLRGQEVAHLTANTIGQCFWDGKNKSGHSVSSGVYFAIVESGADRKVLKVAIQR